MADQEQPLQKRGSHSARRQPSRRPAKHAHSKKTVKDPKLSKSKEAQLDECMHRINARSFKLFGSTDHSTLYGITVQVDLSNQPVNMVFILHVPYDYPSIPLKLTARAKNDQYKDIRSRVAKNFNLKTKQGNGESIFAQINYLYCNIGLLMSDKFKNVNDLTEEFYKGFI